MAWWNDILGALRNELDGSPESAAAGEFQTRAPCARRRRCCNAPRRTSSRPAPAPKRRAGAMLRAQGELEELTRSEWQHPRYRDRLVELARAVALESELVGGTVPASRSWTPCRHASPCRCARWSAIFPWPAPPPR
ncbi:hypothetical protein PEC18_37380, partial [Paucibacter sp. O1-1]|nr:hypothetical protein [Paucibacter sp. O1-1]MDA3831323.1 hypothetical protein [Paucibacter sp. O1-1]